MSSTILIATLAFLSLSADWSSREAVVRVANNSAECSSVCCEPCPECPACDDCDASECPLSK